MPSDPTRQTDLAPRDVSHSHWAILISIGLVPIAIVRSRAMQRIGAVGAGLAIMLLLMPIGASAQSRTFYGADGKGSGRSTTGTNGAVTYYDSSGRVTGRSSISGTTRTFYDANGRRTGSTVTTQQGRR